jgi:hypothetical protein
LFIGFWLVLGSVLCWVFWPPWEKEGKRKPA